MGTNIDILQYIGHRYWSWAVYIDLVGGGGWKMKCNILFPSTIAFTADCESPLQLDSQPARGGAGRPESVVPCDEHTSIFNTSIPPQGTLFTHLRHFMGQPKYLRILEQDPALSTEMTATLVGLCDGKLWVTATLAVWRHDTRPKVTFWK